MTEAIIVGGGIGGLTAAVGLLQAGVDVLVVEQAHQFGEVGAGVGIQANVITALAKLGLVDQFAEFAAKPRFARFLRWEDGRVLTEAPANSADTFPHYSMYRPDIIEILSSLVPVGSVRFNAPCIKVVAGEGEHPQVHLADGTVLTADVVIGADGTHSIVRRDTVGDAPARFSGLSAYRAVIPSEPVPLIQNWLGPDRFVTTYSVGKNADLFNVVFMVPDIDRHSATESWRTLGSLEELHSNFRGWDPALLTIIDQVTEPVYKYGLYDREPLRQWSTSSTTLVGDAAHAMLPLLGQGACQAILDAASLAEHVSASPQALPVALANYERERLPVSSKIVNKSWENNTLDRLPDGPEQQQRDALLATYGAGVMANPDFHYSHIIPRGQ